MGLLTSNSSSELESVLEESDASDLDGVLSHRKTGRYRMMVSPSRFRYGVAGVVSGGDQVDPAGAILYRAYLQHWCIMG